MVGYPFRSCVVCVFLAVVGFLVGLVFFWRWSTLASGRLPTHLVKYVSFSRRGSSSFCERMVVLFTCASYMFFSARPWYFSWPCVFLYVLCSALFAFEHAIVVPFPEVRPCVLGMILVHMSPYVR